MRHIAISKDGSHWRGMENKAKRHIVGYARVSTKGQRLDLQLKALKEYGIPEHLIFSDTLSGAKTARSGLRYALLAAREGGALVVWKLDRLGRTVRGILDTVELMKERGIELVSLSEQIDTRTPMGRFVFHILAAMAQMERDLTIERTMAGQEAARGRGITGGRKSPLTPEIAAKVKTLLAQNLSKEKIAKEVGVSRATIYNWLRAERDAQSESESETSDLK